VVTFGTGKPGSLAGLNGVAVVVELLSPEIEQKGLRTEDVKTDVAIGLPVVASLGETQKNTLP
jgi:hypothetical protein